MDQLNDDCQLRIIKYLDLTDQVLLWKATKHFSERLNANICRAWQQQLNFTLDWVMYDLEDDPEVMDEFLLSICETLQSLKIEEARLDNFQLWRKYKYPNMRELEYWMDEYEDLCNHDPVLELFAELFPALSSLKPYGELDCLKICDFKHLRRLDLTESVILDLKESESLEELIIDFGLESKDFNFNSLMCFPKLQALSYKCQKGSEELLDKIIKERGNDITELDLDDLQYYSTETQLWNTVSACPSLKILNLSRVGLSEEFFSLSREYMNQALKDRSVPFTLYCHNTHVDKDLVSMTKLHGLLCISLFF